MTYPSEQAAYEAMAALARDRDTQEAAIITAARALVGTDRGWSMVEDSEFPDSCFACGSGVDVVHTPDCPAEALTRAVLGEPS
jgi:hypothetical protein